MRVFLSYSRNDKKTVAEICSALNAAGIDTFLDTENLPIGQEYNTRIKRAIDDSDLFVFLASEDSVRPGSYAMTELAYAEAKWRNPSGYVLPVIADGFDANSLPAYVKAVTALDVEGNRAARIVAWVNKRTEGGDDYDDRSPRGRLIRWAQLAQPPVTGKKRVFAWSMLPGIPIGIAFVVMGIVSAESSGSFGNNPIALGGVFFGFVGVAVILYAIWKLIQGLAGSDAPIPIVVLDRHISEQRKITLQAETTDGRRLNLTPFSRAAKRANTGDLGWAYIRGSMLLDFAPASSAK